MYLKKGDLIELSISDVVYKGYGLGRYNNIAIFIPFTDIGDKVKAKITERKKTYCYAKLIEILEKSPDRIKPVCPYFTKCGGCSWQHIPYEKQLSIKRKIVKESFEKLGNISISEPEITPSPEIYHYRNKMEFSFGIDENGMITIGQHVLGKFNEIVSIEKCLLHPPIFDKAVYFVRKFLKNYKISVWDAVSHQGSLRQLMLRYGKNTDELMIVITSSDESLAGFIENFANYLFENIPQLKSFFWAKNTRLSDVFAMEEIFFKKGKDYITEKLGNKIYKISPLSFFQTNTMAAKLLYDKVKEYCNLRGYEEILDAYCGTGSIGIYLADKAHKIWGIDVIGDAIFNARENAKLNKLENTVFLQGQLRNILPSVKTIMKNLDVIIIDPPRAGMHKKAIKHLISLNVNKIIYVSCNPTTLARDLSKFVEAGYKLKNVHAFDMCPHTYHIESVVLLEK